MIDKPFAVIATATQGDLVAAVVVAKEARAAGAVVQTPLAHSQIKRQLRRAWAEEPAFVAIVDGDSVEVIDGSDRTSITVSLEQGALILAEQYDRRERSNRVAFSFGRTAPGQTTLPKAA